MSDRPEIPDEAIEAVWKSWGYPIETLGKGKLSRTIASTLEAALPALRKQWEEELLGDEAQEAALKPMLAQSGRAEDERMLAAFEAALQAIHPEGS